MANRKYLFFADVVDKLGMKDLAKLFKETAAQETEHAFAHFRVLHPELNIPDPSTLTEAEKKKIAALCLQLAIDGETYEYTTMYPEFATQAEQEQQENALAQNVPLRRNGLLGDIASAILLLASEEARFITGAYLPVSGGVQMI